MPDRYVQLAATPVGRALLRRLPLPVPVPLVRHRDSDPPAAGPVALCGPGHGGVADVLRAIGADVHTERTPVDPPAGPPAGIVLDATGWRSAAELAAVPGLVAPLLPALRRCGRVILVGIPPDRAGSTGGAVAQRALGGIMRSLGKELRDGSTCNLVRVPPGADAAAESTLRFLLSARSAYVSGQVIGVEQPPAGAAPAHRDRPLGSAVAVVTGAARGIGAAVATVLARDGAQVVCVDTPAQAAPLHEVARRVGGSAVPVDLTDPGAAEVICSDVRERHGGVDVVVHNAGITRDRTLARMDGERWSSVVAVNLTAVERLTDAVLSGGLLRTRGAIVATSSINAIAGSRGQTNYAASKAGVIGLVEALAPELRTDGRRINAVAPGFIETPMTAQMPATLRQAARRLNSLGQGGLPIDVAETVAWLAAPDSAGINGQTVRVCGQALPGA